MQLKKEILAELDSLVEIGKRLDESFEMTGMGGYESSIPEHEHRTFATSALAAIQRIAGESSQYYQAAPKPNSQDRISVAGFNPTLIPGLRGALSSLREAVNSGLLVSLETRLRAAVHDDLLEQGSELVKNGYYVAGMVLIGGVLEDHLRKMCETHSLVWSGKGSIAKYNDLLKDKAYNQAVWRRIQSIGDVRNDAAHGNAKKVDEAEVQDALRFVRRILADI